MKIDEKVQQMVQRNYELAEAGREGEAVGFVFEHIWVTDPTLDVTGRFDVDPVAEYGQAFLESPFCQPLQSGAMPVPQEQQSERNAKLS